MRVRDAAIIVALAGAFPMHAGAQQPDISNAQYAAERAVANDRLLQAEKLLNAGQRGPESEPCKLMGEYFLHIVKAAAAAGAKTRIADWQELNWEEQDAVATLADPHIERNRRLRQVVCSNNPR